VSSKQFATPAFCWQLHPKGSSLPSVEQSFPGGQSGNETKIIFIVFTKCFLLTANSGSATPGESILHVFEPKVTASGFIAA
jgi:hypothetical protein